MQAKRLASRDGAHGNAVADGRTLELQERILAIGVEVEPELFLVVIFLRDQRAASHERSRDARDERVEQALEFLARRRRNAMEARALAVEGVHAVERALGDTPESFVEDLAALASDVERAMVVFLDHPQVWKGAMLFYHADSLSWWRKRKNLHSAAGAAVDEASVRKLEELISAYFHHHEGRGRNCKIEVFRRGDREYYFAYPEDHSKQSIEWVNGQFAPRPHNPAFEVVFVYSQKDGELELNFHGSHKAVEPLQGIFATAILKLEELPPDPRDSRVYDLNRLRRREFAFVFEPTSEISGVAGGGGAACEHGLAGGIAEQGRSHSRHVLRARGTPRGRGTQRQLAAGRPGVL